MGFVTRVYVLSPVPARALHDAASAIVNPDGCDPLPYIDESSDWPDGRVVIRNTTGQGLRAWVSTYYGVDGPINDRDVDDDGEEYGPPVDFMAEVRFETGYGVENPPCNDLHARAVAELGRWLADRSARWVWGVDDGHHDDLHTPDELALLGDPTVEIR